MTACVFKGFYITLGDIHSNGKWYDVFICDGMESDVTVRSDAERGPFNATMVQRIMRALLVVMLRKNISMP